MAEITSDLGLDAHSIFGHHGKGKIKALIRLLSELPTNEFNGFRLYASYSKTFYPGGDEKSLKRQVSLVGCTPNTQGLSLFLDWCDEVVARMILALPNAVVQSPDAIVGAVQDQGDTITILSNCFNGDAVVWSRAEFLTRLETVFNDVTRELVNYRDDIAAAVVKAVGAEVEITFDDGCFCFTLKSARMKVRQSEAWRELRFMFDLEGCDAELAFCSQGDVTASATMEFLHEQLGGDNFESIPTRPRIVEIITRGLNLAAEARDVVRASTEMLGGRTWS